MMRFIHEWIYVSLYTYIYIYSFLNIFQNTKTPCACAHMTITLSDEVFYTHTDTYIFICAYMYARAEPTHFNTPVCPLWKHPFVHFSWSLD